jgi:hypothetical protein
MTAYRNTTMRSDIKINSPAGRANSQQENPMSEQTEIKYLWPNLSPVIRQYIVSDDLGRLGIACSDSVYHIGVLSAHPIDTPAEVSYQGGILMTDTPWNIQSDNTYTGIWYDYDGPLFPASVPEEMLRHITIVQDLGYLMPDKWADLLLSGLDANQPPKTDMNVNQAEEYAHDAGEPLTARAIRHAASNGYISGARKVGHNWLIPYDGFNHYLDYRPKRRRK